MSSSAFQKLKESYSRQRRRQELQKKLTLKRKQLTAQNIQHQRQTFLSLLPIISHQNYEKNRLILSDFARSPDYCYEMLPISFISFDYLLANPFDLPSWQILINLSYYDDFQIPQTQRFAQIVAQLFNMKLSLASQFLLNVSNLPKCSLLCCRLVDEGIIQTIGQNIQKNGDIYWENSLQNGNFPGKQDLEILIYNLLTTLSNIFTLKPILEMDHMAKICELLNYQSRSNKFLKQIHDETIFKLIQNVILEFPEERNVFQMLIFQFLETLSNSFFTYEEESLSFMTLCVRNKVKLNEKLIENLFVSIKSKNNKNKISALKLLQEILWRCDQKEKMEIQSLKHNNFQISLFSNTLPSFEEFSSMFSLHNETKVSNKYQNQQKINTLMTYWILFNENYEKTLCTFLQIYQKSNQKIQQEIIELIKKIIKCLIRQVTNYEPRKFTFLEQDYLVPEMKDFLFITVQEEEMYIVLNECLNSSNNHLILSSLQIVKDLIIFFKDEQQTNLQEQMIVENRFGLLLNVLEKCNISTSIDALISQPNIEITELSQRIVNLLDESR